MRRELHPRSDYCAVSMGVEAAGVYRRTQVERGDQRLSWMRPDQAFFASGACHVLAWVCRGTYPAQPIGIAAVRPVGEDQASHTFATWKGWTFDHCGWQREDALIAANERFEGYPLERVEITVELADFCHQHHHRMPHQYYADPVPRARDYVRWFEPPWTAAAPAKLVNGSLIQCEGGL